MVVIKNMRISPILKLYKSKNTVFTSREIALLWREDNPDRLKNKIKYYLDKGDLIKLRRGVYAKTDFNIREAGVRVYKPAYISFETVLATEGIIFQYYKTIFVASYLSREIILENGQNIKYRKLKNSVLLNQSGIIQVDGVATASPERALLDMLYINPNYYFDNLSGIDWEKCSELVQIYKNKSLVRLINNYHNNV